jgi:hypothetical protein
VSQSARLTVVLHPIISAQPQSRTVRDGTPVTFNVVAEGNGPVRYQWLFNGTPMSGQTNASLVLTNVQLEDLGDYAVQCMDGIGSISSDTAHLTVLARPVLTIQPVSVAAAVGETVVFSVAAAGTLPMNFSWRRNGSVITNLMLNQHTCYWAIAGVQLTNAGRYAVGITNLGGVPIGGLSSNAMLTVLEDRDGDQMPDAWETANGLEADDSADAVLDEDGDGHTNAEEYLAGTNPHDANSCLRLTGLGALASNGWRMTFSAVVGHTYALETRHQFDSGNWHRLAEFPSSTTNRLVEFLDTGSSGTNPARLYRVVTPRWP